MDKELEGIEPKNLDGSTVVETIKRAPVEDAKRVAAEEKEQRQNYYVDPLEQDALMKEKLEKLSKDKPEQEETESSEPEGEIKPDMNVSGFFSTGATAKKGSIMKRPASKNSLALCMIFGIIDGVYSVLYAALLISTGFSTHWFMGWIYAVVVFLSAIILFTGFRSLKAQTDNMKKNAMVGIVGSFISLIPLVAWLIHFIIQIIG